MATKPPIVQGLLNFTRPTNPTTSQTGIIGSKPLNPIPDLLTPPTGPLSAFNKNSVAGLFSVPTAAKPLSTPFTMAAPQRPEPAVDQTVQAAATQQKSVLGLLPSAAPTQATTPKQPDYVIAPQAKPEMVTSAPVQQPAVTVAPPPKPEPVVTPAAQAPVTLTPPPRPEAPIVEPPKPPASPTTTTTTGNTTADQDWQALRDFATKLMNTKDDETLRRQWNVLLMQKGLLNNAAMSALKMRINQDPSLRGQPAGTAFLQELARDQGFGIDQIAGTLSTQAADRIRDLNQHGFDALKGIVEYQQGRTDSQRKELLAAGDFEGYAKAFKDQTGIDVDVSALKQQSPATLTAIDNLNSSMMRNVESGNMDAAKRNFEAIKALSPQAYGNLTFEDVVSGADAYKLQSKNKADIQSSVRTQVTSGKISDALAGLDQLYTKDEMAKKGTQTIASKDLAGINRDLQAAGMATVTDKSELIGREADVFKAGEIASIQKEAGSTVIDKEIENLQGELQKLGYDTTNPEEAQALRSFVLNLQVTGGLKMDAQGNITVDPNSIVPPWNPASPDSHLFTDWPVLAGDGTVMDKGWEPYGADNPKPGENTVRGQYYSELNKKWEDYILKAPTTDRLTREQWFYATKAGTQAPNKADIPGGLQTSTTPSTDTLDIEQILENSRANPNLILSDDQKGSLTRAGRLTEYSAKDLVGKVNKDPASFINQGTAGLVTVGGKIVRVTGEKGGTMNWNNSGGSGGLDNTSVTWIPVVIDGKRYRMGANGEFFEDKDLDWRKTKYEAGLHEPPTQAYPFSKARNLEPALYSTVQDTARAVLTGKKTRVAGETEIKDALKKAGKTDDEITAIVAEVFAPEGA